VQRVGSGLAGLLLYDIFVGGLSKLQNVGAPICCICIKVCPVGRKETDLQKPQAKARTD